MRRPTLDDVAQAIGFSKSAVSLALRNSPKLPPSTRDAIQRVARQLGYRADPMLAALASHRWRRHPRTSGATLAALADGRLEGERGMAERAASYGYRFEVIQIGDYPSPQRLADVLYSRGIVGVIVGQIFTPGFCAVFDWSRFVIVASCEGYERPPVHLIMPNHFRSLMDGWDRAQAAGHRRIGLALFEDPAAIDYHERIAAYLERQRHAAPEDRIPHFGLPSRRHAPPRSPQMPAARETSWRDYAAAMGRWLRKERPDVVLGFSNVFLRLMETAGWKVPEQIAFISLWNQELEDAVPGMCLTQDEVGRRTVDWLDSLLRAGERGLPEHPVTMLVNMRWQGAEPQEAQRKKKKGNNR